MIRTRYRPEITLSASCEMEVVMTPHPDGEWVRAPSDDQHANWVFTRHHQCRSCGHTEDITYSSIDIQTWASALKDQGGSK